MYSTIFCFYNPHPHTLNRRSNGCCSLLSCIFQPLQKVCHVWGEWYLEMPAAGSKQSPHVGNSVFSFEVHLQGMGELGYISSRRLLLAEMMFTLCRSSHLLRKSRCIYGCPLLPSWRQQVIWLKLPYFCHTDNCLSFEENHGVYL